MPPGSCVLEVGRPVFGGSSQLQPSPRAVSRLLGAAMQSARASDSRRCCAVRGRWETPDRHARAAAVPSWRAGNDGAGQLAGHLAGAWLHALGSPPQAPSHPGCTATRAGAGVEHKGEHLHTEPRSLNLAAWKLPCSGGRQVDQGWPAVPTHPDTDPNWGPTRRSCDPQMLAAVLCWHGLPDSTVECVTCSTVGACPPSAVHVPGDTHGSIKAL